MDLKLLDLTVAVLSLVLGSLIGWAANFAAERYVVRLRRTRLELLSAYEQLRFAHRLEAIVVQDPAALHEFAGLTQLGRRRKLRDIVRKSHPDLNAVRPRSPRHIECRIAELSRDL